MIKFGTGGWRAIIAEEFTKENVQLLTTAIARKMIDENKTENGFVIGYDNRFLSDEGAIWAAEVIAGHGIFCRVLKNASPTPLIMHTVNWYDLSYGMAVTASHNPAIYNGVKLFKEQGRDADEELTLEIENYLKKITVEDIKTIGYKKGIEDGIIKIINPINNYVDDILKNIDIKSIRDKNLDILIDPMHGVATNALLTILYTARCVVKVINQERDTLFGGHLPSPTEETLINLMNIMKDSNWDLGIANDGDADRLGIVDDNGYFLHPNKILSILYYYLLEYRKLKGPVVRNLATTHLLDKIAKDHGEICYEVPVGFKFISEKMEETDAIIGGESSGGLTVRGHIKGKDGIYAAALFVEMLAVTGKKASEILKEIETKYGSFEMIESNLSFSKEEEKRIFSLLMVEKSLPKMPVEIKTISYQDGVKIYFERGWLVARFSGTEPLLRVFCEMETKREAIRIIEIFEEFIGITK